MPEIAAGIFTLLQMCVGWWYCRQAILHPMRPKLTTWLLFVVACSMSLGSFIGQGQLDIVAGIANVVDVVVVVAVTITLLMVGNRQVARFDMWCLSAAGLICGFWFTTSNHFWVNMATNVLLVVAYFPTYRSQWKATPDKSEDPWFWILILVGALLALYPAATSGKLLTIVYAGRAVVCVSVLLILIFRAKMRITRAPA